MTTYRIEKIRMVQHKGGGDHSLPRLHEVIATLVPLGDGEPMEIGLAVRELTSHTAAYCGTDVSLLFSYVELSTEVIEK